MPAADAMAARRARAEARLKPFMKATVQFDTGKEGPWDPQTDKKRPADVVLTSKARVQPVQNRFWTEDTVNPLAQHRVRVQMPTATFSTKLYAGMGVTIVADPTNSTLVGKRGIVETAIDATDSFERTVQCLFDLHGGGL